MHPPPIRDGAHAVGGSGESRANAPKKAAASVGRTANWALLASLIETCEPTSVNLQDWLADVLSKLVNNWPGNRLDELLPWAWKPATQA